MPLDCIIRGGTVAAADGTRKTDVGVKDGLIASLGDDLGPAAEAIDASGLLVLPGGIDSHVHLAQPSGFAAPRDHLPRGAARRLRLHAVRRPRRHRLAGADP